MDVVGGVLLADGTEAKVLTGVDDHSRFCVCAGIMVRATARPVCGVLRRRRSSATASPRRSSPTTARSSPAASGATRPKCSSTRSAGRTGSPTASPHPARRQRPARSSVSTARCASSSSPARSSTRPRPLRRPSSMPGSRSYNTDRPHQSLKMATPAERFFARADGHADAALDRPQALDQDRSGDDWVSRTVSNNGTISVSNQVFSVGKHRAGADHRRARPRRAPRGLGRHRNS